MVKLNIQMFGGRGAISSNKPKAISLNDYLSSKGLSQVWYSDQGFADTNTGRLKGRAFIETERIMQQRSADYSSKRNKAINEYNKLVKNGKIRKPTLYEETLKISKGNPESPQVQSAKRLLVKLRKKGLNK